MKGNDGTGNVVDRDDWQTPTRLFDSLDRQFEFEFDCCAIPSNSKCLLSTDDFLFQGQNLKELTCWMNPPFSKCFEMFDHFFNVVQKGVAIYWCDNMETKVWQDIILKHATWILIPRGRISYEGKEGKGSRFPSALIGFNVPIPVNVEGAILKNILDGGC